MNDDVLTFLRRADRHTVGKISHSEVAKAIREAIFDAGRSIESDLVEQAVDATGGYPFLIQLVGYHIWRQNPDSREVEPQDVERGVAAAHRRLGSLVLDPELDELTDVERSFLLAMAVDSEFSSVRDIAERLEVDGNYVSQYRLRLIRRELIESVGHGKVDFALPFLRDYLRDSMWFEARYGTAEGSP